MSEDVIPLPWEDAVSESVYFTVQGRHVDIDFIMNQNRLENRKK